MSDRIDQTAFSADQPFADKSVSSSPGQSGDQSPEPKKKNALLLVIIGVVCIVAIVVVALVVLNPTGTEQAATPTPQASESPRLGGGLLEEIEPLLEDAKTGNPEENRFPAPPIRFELYIQD